MNTPSSEYGFPIFISSTDYNLVDLRAELSKYLSDLGYRPILSSSDGFHDNSPDLEPWESCLQVLQTAYVMVLVIDGRYGDKFEWKNFTSILGDRKVSPTHAEYIFAHQTKMRMLVFIRKELLTYYQTYRTAVKNSEGDKEKAKESLSISLPKHVSFEALEFIEEVKTARPIPWIKPFENVTEIKEEIQKKMLNELSEIFLFRNKHLQAVIRAFSTVLDDLPEDKRKETLERIGATKELIVEIESQTKVISELKKEKDKLESQLEKKTTELEKAQKDKKKESAALQKKVKDLSEELESLDTRISSHELNNANYLITGSSVGTSPYNQGMVEGSIYYGNNLHNSLYSARVFGNSVSGVSLSDSVYSPGAIGHILPSDVSMVGGGSIYGASQICDKCHQIIPPTTSLSIEQIKNCPTCGRMLCTSCFYGIGGHAVGVNAECEECRNKAV